jgi:hypothetical protein
MENNTGDLLGRSDTSGGSNVGGGIPLISGVNDMARGAVPGLGAAEDMAGGIGNALLGRNTAVNNNQQAGGGGPSPVTVNTQGGPLPRSLGLLMQKAGINSIPPGVNVNDFADNLLYQMLGGQ